MAKNAYVPLVILIIAILISFLLISGNSKARVYNAERFTVDNPILGPAANLPQAIQPPDDSVAAMAKPDPNAAAAGINGFNASDSAGNEVFNPVHSPPAQPTQSCYPRDRLSADDLLPKDAANSRWAQMNPAGQGDISDINFLTAGYHIGINSVGSTKKNPNLQLRSEPANPQVVVSPWFQSTIQPSDIGNRRPFEIGGDW
jgi:hypothetical protein